MRTSRFLKTRTLLTPDLANMQKNYLVRRADLW